MEELNKFIGGIDTDHQSSEQPSHTARHIKNFVALSKDGNKTALTNEDGTELKTDLPTGFRIMGQCVLNNEVIVILVDNSGNNQIGILKPYQETGGVVPYEQLAPVNDLGVPVIDNKELGFSINLDNPPVEGSVAETSKLIQSQEIPTISYVRTEDSTDGQLHAGVVQFVTRYVTSNGGETTFGLPCNPISITPSLRADGVDKYKGGYYNDDTIPKSIVLEITEIDQNFQELEIFVIEYKGEQSVFSASRAARITITDETLSYTYNGVLPDDTIKLTKAEITTPAISYDRAKCIEQKDNRVFFSNLKAKEQEVDLQEIFNNVSISYEMEDMPFCNRGTTQTNTGTVFGLVSDPILNIDGSINLVYNEDIDPATVVPADFTLKQNGTPALGAIRVSDYAVMVPGDTITIVADVLTVVAATPDTGEFLVGATNEDTILNIANALQFLNSTDYSASVNGIDLDFTWVPSGTVGNGQVISHVSAGLLTTAFAGGTNTITSHVADTAVVDGPLIVLTFPVSPTLSDTLDIESLFTVGGVEYQASDLSLITSADSVPTNSTTAAFSDYIDEGNCFYKKTYRRDEVYSFGAVLMYKDGSTSNAYHIPGNSKLFDGSSASAIIDGRDDAHVFTDGGLLGTYRSELTYPNDDYPTVEDGYVDTNIRHHWMPTIADEPLFEVVGDVVNLRIIKLKFEFGIALPTGILNDVRDILFVKERRNSSNKKSILGQGLFNNLVESADTMEHLGDKTGYVRGNSINNISKGYCLIQTPFFNQFTNIDFPDVANVVYRNYEMASGLRGIAYPSTQDSTLGGFDRGDSALPGFNTYENGQLLDTEIVDDQGVFLSPETILSGSTFLTSSDASSATLVPLYMQGGDVDILDYSPMIYRNDDELQVAERYEFLDMFSNLDTPPILLSTLASPPTTLNITNAISMRAGTFRAGEKLDPDRPFISTR